MVSTLMPVPGASAAYPRPSRMEQVDLHRADAGVGSGHPSISASGRFIAYTKQRMQNLPILDVFVTDTRTGRTEVASKGMNGEPAVGAPSPTFAGCELDAVTCLPSISGDGRYVAFMSSAANIVPGDTNGMYDIFVYDRRKGSTIRASVDTAEGQATLNSFQPSLSFNGRYVSFTSDAPDLVEGDTNNFADIFHRDLRKGVTRRVSVNSEGGQAFSINCLGLPSTGNQSVDQAANQLACSLLQRPRSSISYDGQVVAFESAASDLVTGDTNRLIDVFAHDLKSGATERVSVDSSGGEAAVSTGFGQQHMGSRLTFVEGGGESTARAISGDGRYVVFSAAPNNLVPNDRNGYYDVFVHDRKTRRTDRVSVYSDGGEMGLASIGAISGNGRYVYYTGEAQGSRNRHAGDNAYRYDMRTGEWAYHYVTTEPGKRWIAAQDFPDPSHNGEVAGVRGHYYSWQETANGPVAKSDGEPHIFKWSFGAEVGTGGLDGERGPRPEPEPDRICITPTVCIPPGLALSVGDDVDDVQRVLTDHGANLFGASIAYRPGPRDLFAVIELEHMPQVVPGASPIFYGLRFEVQDKSYEVRAASVNYGTFGLFDVTHSKIGTKVANLRGGYGTSGMRVVLSLPLDEIGLEDGGKLRDVEAFSGLGSYLTGATKILDTVRLR